MASIGYIKSLLNTLDAEVKRILDLVFEEATGHLSLGANTKATNFDWFQVSSTTHATAGTEFSIAHGLDHVPSRLIPIVDLTVVNSQLVGLSVSRLPDARRVYLTSASTSVVFSAYVE